MAVERTGVYPGTFDPITSGHMEIVRRSLRLVDRLVIGPAMNIGKGPLFTLEERREIIKDDIADWDHQPLFPQRDVRTPTAVHVGDGYKTWLTEIHELLSPQGTSRAGAWRRAQALQWCEQEAAERPCPFAW